MSDLENPVKREYYKNVLQNNLLVLSFFRRLKESEWLSVLRMEDSSKDIMEELSKMQKCRIGIEVP